MHGSSTTVPVTPFLSVKVLKCLFYDHTGIKANIIQAGFKILYSL